MRVTTDFWVSALMRRAFAAGGFATVAKRGSPEAGAVLLILRDRFGTVRLFAPAPQASYGDARPEERLFVEIPHEGDETEVEKRIERELRFDPDLWLVEIETDEETFAKLLGITTP